MTSRATWTLVIVLGLALGAAGFWASLSRVPVEAPTIGPAVAGSSTRPLAAPELSAPRTEEAVLAAPQDAEQFLSAYWGAEWPRIESELRKQEGWADYDLSKLPLPPPLEEALPKLRTSVDRWNPKHREKLLENYLEIGSGSGRLSDREWIRTKYGQGMELGDPEFAILDAEVKPTQRILEESAERIVDAILAARIRLFDERDFGLAPYSTAGVEDPRSMRPGLLNTRTFGWEGWSANISVLESDVPGWKELREENLRLILERNRILKEVLARFR